jgi:transcriptional regulator with XRE-family HTH domain
MKITDQLTDEAILSELGQRLARLRVEREVTQEELAKKAGVGKRTLERIEAGGSSQTANLIRVFRALELIDALDGVVPEPRLRPMELLEQRSKQRRRASTKRRKRPEVGGTWTWGDEQ